MKKKAFKELLKSVDQAKRMMKKRKKHRHRYSIKNYYNAFGNGNDTVTSIGLLVPICCCGAKRP